MIELPCRPARMLRWRDGDRTYLYNPKNNLCLATTPAFESFLDTCSTLDRAEMERHLAAVHSPDVSRDLFARLDGIGDLLGILEAGDAAADPPLLAPEAEGFLDTLTLTLTHACNLRCDYCFDGLEFMKRSGTMPPETARAALEFLFAGLGQTRRCCVIFTGGEPLLNWPVLEETVLRARDMARERHVAVEFRLKTNGLLVDDRALRFFAEHDFTVQVSIDGRQEDHDRARIDALGRGSFERAVEASGRIAASLGERRLQIRATVTKQNIRNYSDNLRFLLGLRAGTVSCGLVMAAPDSPHVMDAGDLAVYQDALFHFAQDIARNPQSTESRRLLAALRCGGGPYGSASGGTSQRCGCGAGLWHLSVDVDGTILPCYRLAGRPRYVMGHVEHYNWRRVREVQERVHPIYARQHLPRCRKCWGQGICRQSCVASHLLDRGEGRDGCGDGVVLLESILKSAVRAPEAGGALMRF